MFGFITRPIGCLFSLVGSIVVIALVLVLAGLGLIAHFMPQMTARAITEATGFPTSVGSSSLSLWHQRLELKDIRINNPDNYPEDDFLLVRRLALGIDRKNSDTGRYVFNEVTLDIDTLTLVRLSAMVLNGNDVIRNLLLNQSLSPATTATTTAAAATALPQTAYGSYPLPASPTAAPAYTQPQAQQLTPQQTQQLSPPQTTGSAPAVRFTPVAPPPLPELPSLAATLNAEGKPIEPARWLITRLNIRIDSARLFESSPQGNYLQLVPLNYERSFDNVTSLRAVLPTIIADLNRRGLPLGLPLAGR